MTSFDQIGNCIADSGACKPSEAETKDSLVAASGAGGDKERTLSNKSNSKTASAAIGTGGNKLAYIEIDYDDLETYERCGRGAYGSVYKGLWKSRGKVVAIKKLLQLENEAEILSMCSHRNIIQFYGIVSKASNYCIITEYAEYGSLHDFIKAHDLYEEFGIGLILQWAHDIALGMNYLHSEAPVKIIHRDLKSNNVLIKAMDDTLVCKICDFGSSRFGIQTTKMTVTGTFPWMSPEIIQSKPANSAADVWSYGVVLWELITGEIPFKGIDEFQIAFLVVERDYRLPIPSGCPSILSSMMQQCWQTDPKVRPTFKAMLTTLDQLDLDDEAKTEIDTLFTNNKSKWENEIEQAFERLKKIEDDLHIKEKLLEAREKRLREMEMELITANTKLISFEEHDINSWTENDVYEWIKKVGLKYMGIGAYCENFLAHNINGKRLLLMTKADLRNIGISSEGHIIDIFHEIETLKIENIRLLNFPPLKQTSPVKSQLSLRNISYSLLIGSHIIHNHQKPENTKWKIYIDIDECDDSRDVHVISCIRDVKFVCRNHFEQFNVNKPPFIMRKWAKGLTENKHFSCIITYEDKVIQPRKVTIEYELDCKMPSTQTHLQILSVGKTDTSYLKTTTMSNCSSNASTATNAIALITANIQFQSANSPSPLTGGISGGLSSSSLLNGGTENVWKKRNLENSVQIPQETQTKNSCDLWSGVVAGRYRSNPEDSYIPDHETLKRRPSDTSWNSVRNLSNSSFSKTIIRSQTTSLMANGSRVNNSSNVNSKLPHSKTQSSNMANSITNGRVERSSEPTMQHPKVLKRNLSGHTGYGRGKPIPVTGNSSSSSLSSSNSSTVRFKNSSSDQKTKQTNNNRKPSFY